MHCSTDLMTNTTCDSTDSSTDDGVLFWGHPVYVDEYKSEEDDLWMIIARREWREYLKTLWLSILGARQYICVVGFLVRILYYRRLLFSISGWLARAGQNKRN